MANELRRGFLRQAVRYGRTAARAFANRAVGPIRQPIAVLAYHRVTDLPGDPFRLAVRPERFRQQLAFLTGHFDIVRFESDWSSLVRPSVAITFDDGYADNYLEALPLLEEAGVPATFFVTSGMVGAGREFWWDELERLVLADHGQPTRFTLRGLGPDRTWPAATSEERQALFRGVHRLCMRRGPEPYLAQLRAWAAGAPGPRATHRALDEHELLRLAASPLVTIGAHTRTHPSLAHLNPRAQRAEILGSKADLEIMLGRSVEVFSYPFGERENIGPETVRTCARAFRKAAQCHGTYVMPWTHIHLIPRMVAFDWDAAALAERLSNIGLKAG